MFSNFDFLHGQVLVGLLISLACIAVHAVVMALVRWGAFRTSRAVVAASNSVGLVLVMMATVSILMMAHIADITIWRLSYVALHTIKDQSEAF